MISEWFRRLWYLINRRRIEHELQQEMEAHRQMMAEPRQFGNSLRLREQSRDVWGWNWFDDSWRDLRSAAGSLCKTPGFTIGAVLILSFGLGLNLAVFQVMNIGVFRPLPVRDVGSLVRLRWNSLDGRSRSVPSAAVPI